MAVEDFLRDLIKESGNSSKNQALVKCANIALESMKEENASNLEPYQLRDRILEPLQLALECSNLKLSDLACKGINAFINDDRFQSSMESELEEQWLPTQILNTVWGCPELCDEIQVEIMKILLNLVFSSDWCMNAKIVVKICQLSVHVYLNYLNKHSSFTETALSKLRDTWQINRFEPSNTSTHAEGGPSSRYADDNFTRKIDLLQMTLHAFTGNNEKYGVRMAARGAMTQILKAFTERYRDSEDDKESSINANDMASSSGVLDSPEELQRDVLDVFHFLCDKLTSPQILQHNRAAVPLYLDGISIMINSMPVNCISQVEEFTDIIWKQLCPCLVALLANPKADKIHCVQQTSCNASGDPQMEEIGRGSGVTEGGHNLSSEESKSIYSIAIGLIKLVGNQRSMRPVLESLFHRILLYPPPAKRAAALKSLKTLFSSCDFIYKWSGPCYEDVESINSTKKSNSSSSSNSTKLTIENTTKSNLRLLKIIMDALRESCRRSNDPNICILGVNCIHLLLTQLNEFTLGSNLTDDQADLIEKQFHSDVLMKDFEPCRIATSSSSSSSRTDKFNHAQNNDELSSSKGINSKNDNHIVVDDEVLDGSSQYKCAEPFDDLLTSRGGGNGGQDEFAHQNERQNARDCVLSLLQILPSILTMNSPESIDEALQMFASHFCKESLLAAETKVGNSSKKKLILNADGIYVAVYRALALNMKLLHNQYYQANERNKLCVTEKQFIESVLGCGMLLYLSETWLSEMYRLIIEKNYLSFAGYKDPEDSAFAAFTDLMMDLDGLGLRLAGGQFLSSYRRHLQQEETVAVKQRRTIAGRLFAKCLLLACWDTVMDTLTVLLDEKHVWGRPVANQIALLVGTEGARKESRRLREAIILSLEGLQLAAHLTSSLGLQHRCGIVFSSLVDSACQLQNNNDNNLSNNTNTVNLAASATTQTTTSSSSSSTNANASSGNRSKPMRMHSIHALSLDVVLSRALEMGSYSSDCWPFVFNCCMHVGRLEWLQFSQMQSSIVASETTGGGGKNRNDKFGSGGTTMDDELECGNYSISDYNNVSSSTSHIPKYDLRIPEILHQWSTESSWESQRSGILTVVQTGKILCTLSQLVDKLFEEAAQLLTLDSLLTFVRELIRCSSEQLRSRAAARHVASQDSLNTSGGLLLDRLFELYLRCIRSERPLIHLLRLWALVSPHLVEASSQIADPMTSRRAVTSLHECIITMINTRPERLAYFHVNEFLCKPIEMLICMEMCDSDIQDQIVCCICELVEACSSEIQSGWRPLFGALRCIRIDLPTNEETLETKQPHLNPVQEVFEVFLSSDNPLVFANAAIDCILCLHKYVRSSGSPAQLNDLTNSPIGNANNASVAYKCDSSMELDDNDVTHDTHDYPTGIHANERDDDVGTANPLCLPALSYLQRCSQILATMWRLKHCPSFKGCQRIPVLLLHTASLESDALTNYQSSSTLPCVEALIPDMDLRFFSSFFPQFDLHLHEWTLKNLSFQSTRKDDDTLENSNEKSTIHSTSENALIKSIDQFDEQGTGVARVWFLLIDGLLRSVMQCHRQTQSNALNCACDLVRLTQHTQAGLPFMLFVVNTLLLPQLQFWLRQRQESALQRRQENLQRSESSATGTTTNTSSSENHHRQHKTTTTSTGGGGGSGKKYDKKKISSEQRKYAFVFSASRENNLRQAFGLITDLTVDILNENVDNSNDKCQNDLSLLLKQMMDVLIECMSLPDETFSRLGSSCLRHLLLSAGPNFNDDLWLVASEYLQKAIDYSFSPLLMLMVLFRRGSDEFYGDFGHLKVAARRDLSAIDCERLRQLAQQVFLYESQQQTCPSNHQHFSFTIPTTTTTTTTNSCTTPQTSSGNISNASNTKTASGNLPIASSTSTLSSSSAANACMIDYTVEEMRNYVFLLYPKDPKITLDQNLIISRIQFSAIVHGILSFQVLLQTLSDILLAGCKHVTDNSRHLIRSKLDSNRVGNKLPGVLDRLNLPSFSRLLESLIICYHYCLEFDQRPGLKFLLQKVMDARVAANLYRPAGVAANMLLHLLSELCHFCASSNSSLSSSSSPSPSLLLSNKSLLNSWLPSKLWNQGNIFIDTTELTKLVLDELSLSPPPPRSSSTTSSSSSKSSVIASCQDENQQSIYWRYFSSVFACLTHAYIGMLVDKDNLQIPDRLSEKPLFFLLARSDEFTELRLNKGLKSGLFNRIVSGASGAMGISNNSGTSTTSSNSTPIATTKSGTNQKEDFLTLTERRVVKSDEIGQQNNEQAGLSTTTTATASHNSKITNSNSTANAQHHFVEDVGNAVNDDKIYTMASENTIHQLLTQYKKRKLQQSLPNHNPHLQPIHHLSTLKSVTKSQQQMNHGTTNNSNNSTTTTEIQEEVIREQVDSMLKDSEARLQSWASMLRTGVELILLHRERNNNDNNHHHDDEEEDNHHLFDSLVTCLSPSLTCLMAMTNDLPLKHLLAECFLQMAKLHGFFPTFSDSDQK